MRNAHGKTKRRNHLTVHVRNACEWHVDLWLLSVMIFEMNVYMQNSRFCENYLKMPLGWCLYFHTRMHVHDLVGP